MPLTARIHEGLVFSNRDRQTLLEKLLLLLAALRLPEPVRLVADAYYACGKIIAGLLDRVGHLISRLKKNACAYTVRPARRGRAAAGPHFTGRKSVCAVFSPGPSGTCPARSTASRASPCAGSEQPALASRRPCRPLRGRHSSPPRPNYAPVRRSHALSGRDHPALLTSRFSRRSSGSMPCASRYSSVSSRHSTPSAPGPIISGCAR